MVIQKMRLSPCEPRCRGMRNAEVPCYFPGGQSCLNLAAARLRHIAAGKWSVRKYMSMAPLYQEQNQA